MSDIKSIGAVAGELQYPVTEIELAATKLNIAAKFRINGIPYLDVDDVNRIAEHLKETNDGPSDSPKQFRKWLE